MREEWFYTQERLLGTTRSDGHRASAQDTGNTFKYKSGVGWTPYVPVDGLVGQPLVVAEDRGISSFAPTNHLVPLGGAAGNLAKVDAFGDTQVAPRDEPGGSIYPIDFTDGALHGCSTRVIYSDSIGPNGFVKVTIYCRVVTNAGRGVTIGVTTPPMNLILTTSNLTSSVNDHVIIYEWTMVNQNDGTIQSGFASIENALRVPGAGTSSNYARSIGVSSGAASADTTTDWILDAQVQASSAITGTALIEGVTVEYGYVP